MSTLTQANLRAFWYLLSAHWDKSQYLRKIVSKWSDGSKFSTKEVELLSGQDWDQEHAVVKELDRAVTRTVDALHETMSYRHSWDHMDIPVAMVLMSLVNDWRSPATESDYQSYLRGKVQSQIRSVFWLVAQTSADRKIWDKNTYGLREYRTNHILEKYGTEAALKTSILGAQQEADSARAVVKDLRAQLAERRDEDWERVLSEVEFKRWRALEASESAASSRLWTADRDLAIHTAALDDMQCLRKKVLQGTMHSYHIAWDSFQKSLEAALTKHNASLKKSPKKKAKESPACSPS